MVPAKRDMRGEEGSKKVEREEKRWMIGKVLDGSFDVFWWMQGVWGKGERRGGRGGVDCLVIYT